MERENGDREGRRKRHGGWGGTVEGERSYLLDSFSSGCFYQQGVRWYLHASRYASSFPLHFFLS
jgi:hypothetical protein